MSIYRVVMRVVLVLLLISSVVPVTASAAPD